VSGVSGLSLSTPQAAMPSDVRNAGAEAQQTYRAALAFERTLLEQLTKTMATGANGEGEDGEDSGASAATSAYRDMLPGTLADAVTGAGGLGLAHDLFLSMRSAS
jgi:Rod binding domain-containing protein